MYPESTTLITEMVGTEIQLKPATYIELSIALRQTGTLLGT